MQPTHITDPRIPSLALLSPLPLVLPLSPLPQGDTQRAVELYTRAMTIKEKLLGLDNQDTMGTVSNLASVHYKAGQMKEAAALFLKVGAKDCLQHTPFLVLSTRGPLRTNPLALCLQVVHAQRNLGPEAAHTLVACLTSAAMALHQVRAWG